MRSCEYTSTPNGQQRKTKLLWSKNVRFFMKGMEILIPKAWSRAKTISINFETQKNDDKCCSVTQVSTDQAMCPVKVWEKIKPRVISDSGQGYNALVNTIKCGSVIIKISPKQVSDILKRECLEERNKGYSIEISRVGTHSIRCRASMLMFQGKVKSDTIQIVGRWKITAYQRYLRPHTQDFTSEVTQTMVNKSENAYLIPDQLNSEEHPWQSENNVFKGWGGLV